MSTGSAAWADCSNGEDDDGNGLIDWPADPGCRSAADPFEFEFEPGDLLVIDSTPDALLHIDPATGARRVLHAGAPFEFPQGLALDHHHGVLVSDTDADAVFRFDLEDGSDRIEMHRGAIEPGQRVLLVDDLIATGGTAEAAVELLNEVGAEVVECAFVIALPDLGGIRRLEKLGCRLHWLCEFEGD